MELVATCLFGLAQVYVVLGKNFGNRNYGSLLILYEYC